MSRSNRITFTGRALAALKPQPGRRPVLWDDKVPGLGLYVTDRNVKTFFLQRTYLGKQIKVTLGHWRDGNVADMTIAQARTAALEAIAQINRGEDPRRAREVALSATFGDLWHIYLSHHAQPRKRSVRCDVSQYTNHLSHLARRPLGGITRVEMMGLHRKLWNDIGGATANRVMAQVSVMFELARDWGLFAGDNPARRIPKAASEPRQRVVEAGEFPALLRAMHAHPQAAARDALLMCLWTGQRKGNVVAMRWDQIDAQLGRWLIPRTKSGRAHPCPLTAAALEVLEGRPRVSPWVFPGRDNGRHLKDVTHAWRKIRTEAAKVCPSLVDLRIHDLRRTNASWQARTGASLAITSAGLAHRSIETTRKVYALVDLDPTRAAMDAACRVMQEMAKGKGKA